MNAPSDCPPLTTDALAVGHSRDELAKPACSYPIATGASAQFEPRAEPVSSDAELVRALRAGEPGAAAALYRYLHSAVTRTLYRILRRTSADHDDLVQVTFERLFRTLIEGKFAGACSLNTWVTSIATHAALDNLRVRVRERRLFVEEEALLGWEGKSKIDAEHSLRVRADVRQLQEVLARMNPDRAEAVVLFHGLGYSLAELAIALGVSQAAAQARLSRGRRELLKRCDSKFSAYSS